MNASQSAPTGNDDAGAARSQPGRKRFRFVASGLMLFVLGVIGWWLWPHHDPRFVGTWRVVADEKGQRSDTSEVLTFQRSGHYRQFFDGTEQSRSMAWWNDGRDLVLETRAVDLLTRLRQTAFVALERLQGRRVPPDNELRFRVVNVANAEITLHYPHIAAEPTHVVHLRRVAD